MYRLSYLYSNSERFRSDDEAVRLFEKAGAGKGCGKPLRMLVKGFRKYDLPKGAARVETAMFKECRRLESVGIPSGVKYINAQAFSGCRSLKEIEMPGTLKSIGDRAFLGCRSLTTAALPPSVKELGPEAFSGCVALEEATLPSVESLESAAFSGCAVLRSLTAPSIRSIGKGALSGCAVLESFDIPATLESLGENAFNGCAALSSIRLPSTLKSIGPKAFCGCSSLSSIEIPASVAAVEQGTFQGCSSLRTVSADVGSIGEAAFRDCVSLSSARLESVESIGPKAFSGCRALTDLSLPSTLKTIGSKAFTGCTSLQRVEIPSSVTEIGDRAFSGCDSLSFVSVPASAVLGSDPFPPGAKVETRGGGRAEKKEERKEEREEEKKGFSLFGFKFRGRPVILFIIARHRVAEEVPELGYRLACDSGLIAERTEYEQGEAVEIVCPSGEPVAVYSDAEGARASFDGSSMVIRFEMPAHDVRVRLSGDAPEPEKKKEPAEKPVVKPAPRRRAATGAMWCCMECGARNESDICVRCGKPRPASSGHRRRRRYGAPERGRWARGHGSTRPRCSRPPL